MRMLCNHQAWKRKIVGNTRFFPGWAGRWMLFVCVRDITSCLPLVCPLVCPHVCLHTGSARHNIRKRDCRIDASHLEMTKYFPSTTFKDLKFNRFFVESLYILQAWHDGAEVSASGWRSGGPRFKSHPRLISQSWSSYQLNQLGSKAASDSTLKQLTLAGYQILVLYLQVSLSMSVALSLYL